MELKWEYDVNTRTSRVNITENLFYTTIDGGQTIKKYVDDICVNTFHKYGPEHKFANVAGSGSHMDNIGMDEWIDEIRWIANNYPDIVGPLIQDWNKGFLNKKGEIEDVGVYRGMGVLSPENPISVNRIGQPASIQELWDYDVIATSDEDVDTDCHGTGTRWIKHKKTGQIYRLGGDHPLFPCCAYPTIHGPHAVDESDVELHKGHRLI